MALLWTHDDGENHYEVRSAGASIRLYRNGVNHSQWNPNRPLAGSVWDLLTLPALHRESGQIQDGLLLGFGAGAAGRQLLDLAHVARLVGVELDPMHLSIADGFFQCTEGCELVAADAVEWVASQEAGCYDYIVDDLYAEEAGVPERFAPLDREWCEQLAGLLRPGGILVFNMIEPDRVASLPFCRDPTLRAHFPYRVGFQLKGYENRVVAFSEQPFWTNCLEANLREIGRCFPACRGVGRRYLTLPL
jgi:spermidine synthase